MKKQIETLPNFVVTVLVIIAIAASGYLAMWLLGYYLPGPNFANILLLQLALIFIALGIAYGVLKLIFHNARAYDSNEHELRFRDLPNEAPPKA